MDLKKLASGPKSTILFPVAIILIVLVFSIAKPQGALTIATDSQSLGISYEDGWAVQVSLDDIESVELMSAIELGEKIEGVDDGKVLCGTYKNDIFGTYQTYQYIDVEKYIVVKTSDYTLVFNCSTLSKTEEFYSELLEKA